VPPDGEMIVWLRHNFTADPVPNKKFDLIHAAISALELKPLGFDDADMERVRCHFLKALIGFEDSVHQYMWIDNDTYEWLRVPPEWEEARQEAAYKDIRSNWDTLLSAYDAIFREAHAKAIDR
jgi:hypothetical protein